MVTASDIYKLVLAGKFQQALMDADSLVASGADTLYLEWACNQLQNLSVSEQIQVVTDLKTKLQELLNTAGAGRAKRQSIRESSRHARRACPRSPLESLLPSSLTAGEMSSACTMDAMTDHSSSEGAYIHMTLHSMRMDI